MSRDLQDAELALARLRYARQLWELPLIPNQDVPIALGISLTSWQQLKALGTAPPTVMIGKRAFVRSAELKAWADTLAIATPEEEGTV